jgi:hypothetical protein
MVSTKDPGEHARLHGEPASARYHCEPPLHQGDLQWPQGEQARLRGEPPGPRVSIQGFRVRCKAPGKHSRLPG